MIEAAVRKLIKDLIPDANEDLLNGWRIQACWANVNPKGGFNRPHHHEGQYSHFSGFYYVDTGKCDIPLNAGRTIFQDRSLVARPTPSDGDLTSREYGVVPQAGVMLIFPASLYHYVEPYQGEGLRVTIAFNVYHPKFRVLHYPGTQELGWWWTNFRGIMLLGTKIPEKFRALRLMLPYVAQEMAQSRDAGTTVRARIGVAISRALADASEWKEKSAGAAVTRGQTKNPLV
jgi:hypothetical protein